MPTVTPKTPKEVTRKRPPRLKREVHTGTMLIDQPPDIVLPDLDEPFRQSQEVIEVSTEEYAKKQTENLAFMDEPMAIHIEPSQEENPPRCVDVWVNGKGAEMFQNGRWIAYGALPVGVTIITKRKYVEVLARSKKTSVRTVIVNPQAERPENRITRSTSARAVFQVIQDRNPKGHAWLQSVMRSAA